MLGAGDRPDAPGPLAELRGLASQHRLDLILDPLTQPAATPGGFKEAIGALWWGIANRPHAISDFEGPNGRRLIGTLGDFAIEHGFTQVLAPTHLLRSADDPWLSVDAEATRRLHDHLTRRGGSSIQIIYSLAVPYAVLRDEEQRERLVEAIRTVPASALWLKIDGLGSASSGAATRVYLQAASDFHQLDIPVVADQMGGMPGLALMAFGAVGGIAHGITLGERFSTSSWRKPLQGAGFTPSWRVYVQPISMMLTKMEAEALIGASRQSRGWFGCRDSHCCPRGVDDMLARPARHFLCRRIAEVAGLSREPETVRAQQFLERYVRPASDQAVNAANKLGGYGNGQRHEEEDAGEPEASGQPSPSAGQACGERAATDVCGAAADQGGARGTTVSLPLITPTKLEGR